MSIATSATRFATLLERGFRPFFLLAAAYGALAFVAWLWALAGGGGGPDLAWHAREMTFGYLGAVLAGFVLTAVAAWTGRAPVRGHALALLVALWLVARVAGAQTAGTFLQEVAACAFSATLALVVWHEVLRGGSRRNWPVCALFTGIALADAGTRMGPHVGLDPALTERLGLGCVALLVMLIGGRITPAFTRSWMQRAGLGPSPADFSRVDAAALAIGAVAVCIWIAAPLASTTGVLLAIAGTAHTVRLLRWHPWAPLREPLVAALHAAYLWIPVWLLLTALSTAWPSIVAPSAALHALTAGALTTMPLAVMTRATLGHTGRALAADRLTCALFVLAHVAGVLRVLAGVPPLPYAAAVLVSGMLWATAQALFLVRYAPMLLGPRIDA